MAARFALFVFLLLSGCTLPVSTPAASMPTPPAVENPLAATDWRLVSL
jgi:outer membrane biogenesis lipoprotein LolB